MQRRFALFAWSVLAFHLAVILWGAFVRASGSGAGCGEHWPLCNGQIIPSAPINSTIVEYSHRLTSGIALLSVVTLVIWAFRLFPRGSGVRFAASLTLVSTLIECAIGAALVLLRLVGSTESLSRGLWLGAHLTNTLFLLAALSMTAWKPTSIHRVSVAFPGARRIVCISSLGFLIAAILGGFAALGDTLVVSTSLSESIKQDFSAFSNIFVRLRILHPIVAGCLGIWLLVIACKMIVSGRMNAITKRLSDAIVALIAEEGMKRIARPGRRAPAPDEPTQYARALQNNLWGVAVIPGNGGWTVIKTAPLELFCERAPGWSRMRLVELAAA